MATIWPSAISSARDRVLVTVRAEETHAELAVEQVRTEARGRSACFRCAAHWRRSARSSRRHGWVCGRPCRVPPPSEVLDRVGGQQLAQLLAVALAGGNHERGRQAFLLGRRRPAAGRDVVTDAGSGRGRRSGGRWPARPRSRPAISPYSRVEDVAQDEHGALDGIEPLERDEQREAQALGLDHDRLGVVRRAHERVGQPGADVGLAPDTGRAQPVDGQARRRR